MIKLYSSLVIILFSTGFTQAQATYKVEIYTTFDQIIGLDNTGLFNGTEFTDPFLSTDGSYRYLGGFDYTKGSVVYNDQYYTDVLLKYDLLEDNLLTKSNDNLSIFEVKLISEFVSEFKLHKRHFVRLNISGKNEFFELGFNGNTIDLFIKHQKKKRSRVVKSQVQYSFKPVTLYLLKCKENYSQITSKRDLYQEFPELKTQIKDFYHRFKLLYKQDRDAFMKNLVAYLDPLQKDISEVTTP